MSVCSMSWNCSIAAVSIHTLLVIEVYALVVIEGVIQKTKKNDFEMEIP